MSSRIRTRRKNPPAAPAADPTSGASAAATSGGDRDSAAAPGSPPDAPTTADPAARRSRRSWRDLGPLLLLQTAHPRQALLTAAGVTAAAALAGRPARELGLVFLTVLLGQAILGWHNDLVDRRRDQADEAAGKPLADGRLDPGSVWFTLTCAVLVVVPLSLSNGVTAGSAYLVALLVGLLGNVVLRAGLLSWLTWATSYALYPAFLSYGGWGGDALGAPPEISITVLAGVLGVCVHFLRALPGLVADHRDGRRHLPLRVALRTGAPRLLWLSIAVTVLVVAAIIVEGGRVGLSQ